MMRQPAMVVLIFLVGAGLVLLEASAAPVAPPPDVTSFLKQHCIDCHRGKDSEAGFDVTAISVDNESPAGDRSWATLIDRVADGEMPPPDASDLSQKERSAFVASAGQWLRDTIHTRDTTLGRVRGRRLTRRELERSLHELLGIDIPLAQHLPEEGRPGGFTTVADRQTISHHQLAAHLAVIDLALDEAFRRALMPRERVRRDLDVAAIVRTNPKARCREPELRQGKAVVWSSGMIYYGRLPCTTAPEGGWYRFTVTASGLKLPETGGVWCTVHTGPCVSSAPQLQYVTAFEAGVTPRDITFECWLPQGHMLEIRPGDATLAKGKFAGGQVGAGEGDPQNVPGLAIERIVMEEISRGPDDDALRKLLFGDVPLELGDDQKRLWAKPKNPTAEAVRLMRTFAERAFRQPVSEDDVTGHVVLINDLRSEKVWFVDTLRAAYRAILCSPRFLYFVEEPGPLDDFAVATRLSYFLTGGPPDASLLSLARAKKLHDPSVLRRETDRLLAGDGLARFVQDFADEWLDLDQIDFTEPDPKLYPGFDRIVQAGMLAETRRTLAEAIDKNHPVSWLMASDTTWVNDRLARYYGLADVPGDAFDRVQLTAATHRGGLLAQGAILKVTANGNNTSPVVRGVWIGERILGDEIRPPPGGVPAIEPDIRGTTTIREQLERHRADASCASCHRTIDPPGFALENFDPSGRWRDHYIAMKGGKQTPGPKVDPSSVLLDGRSFATFEEFRALVAAAPERLAKSLAAHLLVYGTGGTLSFADREAVTAIAREASKDGYGVRSIIHGVVTSPVFRNK
jgi:hypothetical protein